MKTLISDKNYAQALEKGRAALAQPHATAARFNARRRVLSLEYSNGMVLSFDIRSSAILGAHADADLSDPYVTPGGDGIVFDKSGLSFGIPGLVAPLLPLSLARQKIASVIGQAKSPRKAAASKANGAKGGRPRKPQPAP